MNIKPMVHLAMSPYAIADIFVSPYSRDDRWHPAIKLYTGAVWYWPNITKATEDEAANEAKAAIMDAQLAAQGVISSWNIYQV